MDIFIVKKALVLVVLLLAVFLGEMVMFNKNSHTEDKKPFIAVSSFPLYDISHALLKDNIKIEKLVPFGVEPHTYTPSVKTMSHLNDAALVLYNGLGMEPWIKKEYAHAVDMSEAVELMHNEHKHDTQEACTHHSGVDPHYWLDIHNMLSMTDVLTSKFSDLFPDFEEEINTNAKAYKAKLVVLLTDFQKGLKTCKRNEIVVNHNAFGYLAADYGFHIHALKGFSPDEQVSAKSMRDMTDFIHEEGVKVIFFESFVSPLMAETIATEAGIRLDALHPLANVSEEEAKGGYITLMHENLDKLRLALECQ